jgi:TRAP-type transport system periplasmic protein
MKKAIGIGFIGIVLVLMFIAPSFAQVITLRLADQNPQQGWGPVNALQPWIKKVEAATKGRVKIDVFPSQTLCKGPDTWNAVKSGVADMGWCNHGYWPDMLPLFETITLPALPCKNSEQGSGVLWQLYEKYPSIQKEFKDVHPLLLWTSPPRFLITTKRLVKTMEDMKGLKLRISGGPPSDQLKALGAIPIQMAMFDIYEAMSKGVLDGTDSAWEAVSSFKFYEVAKNYTFTNLALYEFSIIMNKEKWQSLPKDIQEAITSVSGLEGSKLFGRNWYDEVEPVVLEKIKKEGVAMNTYTLPPEEVKRWRSVAGEPIWQSWVKKMEGKGMPEAQQILKTALEMLEK